MLQIRNGNRKNQYMLLLFCLVVVTFIYGLLLKVKSEKYEMITVMHSYQSDADYDNLLINTYLESIRQATNVFYSQYYTINPTVSYYVVTVKTIEAERTPGTENNTYLITFLSEPYIGPHDTIGKDEITFSASYTGSVEITNFTHLFSYPLPEYMKSLEKTPLPGEYKIE